MFGNSSFLFDLANYDDEAVFRCVFCNFKSVNANCTR